MKQLGMCGPDPKWGMGRCSAHQPSTSQTGVITVNRPLDRERIPEYKLTISVKDNPENPRIARRVSWRTRGELEAARRRRRAICLRIRCIGFRGSECQVQVPVLPTLLSVWLWQVGFSPTPFPFSSAT